MVNIYSIPAILALIAKFFILYFSHGAKIQNFNTRLFTLAVIFSVSLSLVEVAGFNYGFKSEYLDQFGFAYFTAVIPVFATLAHLSILIVINNLPLYIPLFIYSYALVLEALLLFTPLLVAGFEPFQGYTIIRIAGPFYGLFEAFVVGSMCSMVFFPLWGLRSGQPALVQRQCKLWVAAATPLALLNIFVIFLPHLRVRWFNSTATTPLLFTLLLAAVGYAVHNKRLIELDFYLPWSRVRKYKTELYAHLDRFTHELPQLNSTQEIVDRLADTLRCPVSLVFRHNPMVLNAGAFNPMAGFPKTELAGLDQMTVACELDEPQHNLQILMRRYQVGAIAPFFFHSRIAASWLLLGETFNKQIYTPQDFKVVNQLFDRLAILLLDQTLAGSMQLADTKRELKELKSSHQQIREAIEKLLVRLPGQESDLADNKSLDKYLSEFEALIIKQTLEHCRGNKAKAARLLGLRANTLHYKLERYGLLHYKS
jgi:DNA-binding protein Fis